MNEFAGKTAVVTGAASGIGRGMAERFAEEKMRVVLSDVEEKPLRGWRNSPRAGQRGDRRPDGRAQARVDRGATAPRHRGVREGARAVQQRGRRHGRARVGAEPWRWEWVLGVNLWGVIHGVRTFLPAMIAHGEEGHVVNTASVLGLLPGPFQSVYDVAKYGVVALSEGLYYETKMVGRRSACQCCAPVRSPRTSSIRHATGQRVRARRGCGSERCWRQPCA